MHKKNCSTYTTFKMWLLLLWYLNLLTSFENCSSSFWQEKRSVLQFINCIFNIFFCSHHHWATLKTKHKPHQISDFVTFFFSGFFFQLINHYLMWEFLMRWGNISITHTNHGTKVAIIRVLQNVHSNSGKKSP